MKRNIAFLLFALTIMASCDKTNENTQKHFNLKSNALPGPYLDQPPYADGVDELQGRERELLQVISDSVLQSGAGWEFYDSKYSDTLHKGLQQTIGFTILSDKDLIERVKNGGTNEDKAALKKYIGVLADNDYSGYCLLYYALREVEDPAFRKEKALKILKYAKNDDFLQAAMTNENAPSNTLNLVELNYSYIDSLKVMAN